MAFLKSFVAFVAIFALSGCGQSEREPRIEYRVIVIEVQKIKGEQVVPRQYSGELIYPEDVSGMIVCPKTEMIKPECVDGEIVLPTEDALKPESVDGVIISQPESEIPTYQEPIIKPESVEGVITVEAESEDDRVIREKMHHLGALIKTLRGRQEPEIHSWD